MELNLVRELIKRHGWTREQVAYRVGCTSRSVENWYNGKVKPIKIFQIKIQLLFNKEQERKLP